MADHSRRGQIACDNCGREFTPRPHSRPDQRFCRDQCRKAFWERGRYDADPEYRERKKKQTNTHYHSLTGLEYAALRLKNRRVQAQYRRRTRAAGRGNPVPTDH